MPRHAPQSRIPIVHTLAKRCRCRFPGHLQRSTSASLELAQSLGCCAPRFATLAHAFSVVPWSPRIASRLTDKRFLIHTPQELLRGGIHRQDRVHEEPMRFVPTSDGSQPLSGLMAGKVDVGGVCCQQHAGALQSFLTRRHPVRLHDLLMGDARIVQKAIGPQGIGPIAHAFRQGC